jgi:pimeloyl-ACP methyl ester carboxylesterase
MSTHVLALHSSGSPAEMWRSLARLPALAGIPLHAPALLGYPPNTPVAVGERVTLAEEIAHVRAQLPSGIARLHLIGHSYGGVVALAMARALPDLVASVWVYEPVIFSALRHDPAAEPEARAAADAHFAAPEFRDPAYAGTEAWCRQFIDYWNRPGSFDRLTADQRAAVLAFGGKIYAELLEIYFAETTFADWRPEAPLTVAYGERTPLPAQAMARGLHAITPGSTLDVIARAGHMAPLTDPASIHPSLGAHFARVGLA